MISDLCDRGLVKANVVRTMDSTRYGDVRITSAGVEYLDESPRMRRAKQFLGKAFDAARRCRGGRGAVRLMFVVR